MKLKSWQKWLAAAILLAGAGYLFRSLAADALQAGVGLVTAAIYLVAYLFTIVALPLGALWLFMFVYSVFLRPWLRAWHIRRIRNARELREVLDRGKSGET